MRVPRVQTRNQIFPHPFGLQPSEPDVTTKIKIYTNNMLMPFGGKPLSTPI